MPGTVALALRRFMPRIPALSELTSIGLDHSCVSCENRSSLVLDDGFAIVAIRSVIRMRNRSLCANYHR